MVVHSHTVCFKNNVGDISGSDNLCPGRRVQLDACGRQRRRSRLLASHDVWARLGKLGRVSEARTHNPDVGADD